MIYNSYKNSYDINHYKLLKISKILFKELGLKEKNFSIFIVGDKKIKDINYKFRNINTTTDVVSLEYKDPFYIGDIYISPNNILKNARKYNISFKDEFDRTFIHGLLHLLGFDHKSSLNLNEKMFIIQEDILSKII